MNKNNFKEETQEIRRSLKKIDNFFGQAKIWKVVLKMALPATILYLSIGIYNFADSILAITLAPKNYGDVSILTGIAAHDLVRLFVQTCLPMVMLINALAILFGTGIGTRVSINIGQNRNKRALNTLKAGTTFAMIASIGGVILITVIAKPWISSQLPPAIAPLIVPYAFGYAWIVVLSLPFLAFNQILTNVFRSEGKNIPVLIAWIVPIFLNLFMDWLLMGPVGMGVQGAAAATTIAYFINSLLLIGAMELDKQTILSFPNLFGFTAIRWISLIGIVLVGLAPFLRAFSSSVTQTAQLGFIQNVSVNVYFSDMYDKAYWSKEALSVDLTDPAAIKIFQDQYKVAAENSNFLPPLDDSQIIDFIKSSKSIAKNWGDNPTVIAFQNYYAGNFMTLITSGAFPIYALFFPAVFGFADAGRPIIAYNFGAKNYNRVRSAFWYSVLFSFIIAAILYVFAAFAVGKPLLQLLNLSPEVLDVTNSVLKIYLLIMPLFSISVGGMLLLGATDRIILSTISAGLQGIILLFPILFLFQFLAIDNTSYQYLFWWYSPVNGLMTSAIIMGMSIFTLKRLETNHVTLEEQLLKIRNWRPKNAKIKKDK